MNKLLSYASDFTSFLLERADVNQIILFGSAARGEADSESDIDLFIEGKADFEKVKEAFFKSKRYKDYWELKGIDNSINIISGSLDDWKDLKNSIISNGIVLYGKYKGMPNKGEHKVMFSWENIKPESKRVLLFKRLLGYTAEGKKYDGLVQKYKGEKISKGSIMAPLEHYLVFMNLFRKI